MVMPVPQIGALNDAKGQSTRDHYKFLQSLEGEARSLSAQTTALKTFPIVWFIPVPLNQDYLYINLPFAFTVNSMTTRCSAGTCTAVAKINTTAITGLTNSVSTSEVTNTATGANAFAAGDDIRITLSGVSSCLNVAVTLSVTLP